MLSGQSWMIAMEYKKGRREADSVFEFISFGVQLFFLLKISSHSFKEALVVLVGFGSE